ncbi:MAG: hypothetical protein CSA35_08875 [Dethiosulfovibrio peptidovorans]|nr:MAG: hypothetical protein CSA35_08875 [Dethiosulfovibrio peptidovorans]
MKKTTLLFGVLLIVTLVAGGRGNMAIGAETKKPEAEDRYEVSLKARGSISFNVHTEHDKEWVDNITGLYLRKKTGSPANQKMDLVSEKNLVDKGKYAINTVRITMDSDLFSLKPEEVAEYEICITSKGADPVLMTLKVTNYRPLTFTLRMFDKNGKLKKVKSYTFDEMKKLAKTEGYYSSGCVMHGLISFRAQGVLLKDLLADAGFEFSKGMSLACRTTDAPTEIKATKVNSSTRTGEVMQNPQKYWIKPRSTNKYKHTYEELLGRKRYFVSAPWDDTTIGQILKDDGRKFSFSARESLASNPKYLIPVHPIIAIKYTELQYNSNSADIRTFQDKFYDLTADERAFRFLYGLALDDDPVVNVTAYDKEAKEYPVVETPENKGKIALEEGHDPCGTTARQAKNVFGIDIFEDGSEK